MRETVENTRAVSGARHAYEHGEDRPGAPREVTVCHQAPTVEPQVVHEVIVYDFAVSPDEVTLDEGLTEELVRSFQSASTSVWWGARPREPSRGR